MRFLFCCMGLGLSLAGPLRAEPAPVTPEHAAAEAALGAVIAQGRVMPTLRALTDLHPNRMSGTPEYAAAAGWAEQQLRDAGATRVWREAFTLPNRWEPRKVALALREPRRAVLHVASVPWSAATPAGGIEAEVVALTPAQHAGTQPLGPEVRGRIVLASARHVFTDPARSAEGGQRLAALHETLARAGARAILWGSAQPNNVVKTVALLSVGSGSVTGLPSAAVGMEDMLMVRRLLERGPVRLHLELDHDIGGPVPVETVIGEIRGREPDEWVLVGAHLDAWPAGSGANDNGIGVAAVIEAARALANAPAPPRRTVRFVLWGGEEQGMLGSSAWVAEHAAELPALTLAINYDHGAGKPTGWNTPGRADLAQALGPVFGHLFTRFGAVAFESVFACNVDSAPFVMAGVPTLELAPDDTHYFDTHHLPSDTFEKIDPLFATTNAALLAAATAFAAEAPVRAAPRLDAAAVDAWLRADRQEACRGVQAAP